MKIKPNNLKMRTVSVAGKKICVYEANRRAKESVLFLHGFMSDATSLKEYIEQVGSDKRIIAPDLPGFGESDALEGEVSLARYARWVDQFCEALKITPSVIVGYSFGAYVAVQYLVNAKVQARLVLLCPVVHIRWQVRMYGQGFRLVSLRNEAFAEKLYRKQYDMTTAYVRKNKHPLIRKGLYERRRNELEYLRSDIVLKLFTQFLTFDLMRYAPKITVPTVIITAAKDNLASNQATQTFAENVGSKQLTCIEIKHAGHLLPIEEPHLLALTTENYINETSMS